jgi:hypothetical protein
MDLYGNERALLPWAWGLLVQGNRGVDEPSQAKKPVGDGCACTCEAIGGHDAICCDLLGKLPDDARLLCFSLP